MYCVAIICLSDSTILFHMNYFRKEVFFENKMCVLVSLRQPETFRTLSRNERDIIKKMKHTQQIFEE